MNTDELKSKCKVFASTSANYAGDYVSVDALEAFARALVVRGMERCKAHHQAQIEYLKPVLHPNDDTFNRTIKTGIEAFQGCVDWIDAEIQRIKEGA